jgi:hypothetical protein
MVYLTPRDATITVGATSTELSPDIRSSGQRQAIVITNTSTGGQVVTLAFGKDAVASVGIVLYPTGAWAESIDSAFIPSNERITAIASAAAGTVTIHERVI